jgi:hypothetical protein
MLVDMVGEAGGLELAVLVGGVVLGLQLRVGVATAPDFSPVAISDIDGVRGFLRLGVPTWDVLTAALVPSVSWAPAT